MAKPRFDLLSILERHFHFLKNIPLLPNIIDEQVKLFTLLFRPQVFAQMMEYVKTVKTWEGISCKYHRYGGLEFTIGKQEIGHIHGNGLVDLYFNKEIAHTIITYQLAETHHVLNETGWISYYMSKQVPVSHILTLTELAYQLKTKQIAKDEVLMKLKDLKGK